MALTAGAQTLPAPPAAPKLFAPSTTRSGKIYNQSQPQETYTSVPKQLFGIDQPNPPARFSIPDAPYPQNAAAECSTSIDVGISQRQLPESYKITELRASIDTPPKDDVHPCSYGSNEEIQLPPLDAQIHLLSVDDASIVDEQNPTDIANAVLLSRHVLEVCPKSVFPQFSLLGNVSNYDGDPRVFLNTNIPISMFICGLQGSGKSHTMSCLLENMLIKSPSLGTLQKPLSALVLHFSEYTTRLSFRPCEAAFLAYPNKLYPSSANVDSVTVLVPPSNYQNLRDLYTQIPGVNVKQFKLRPTDLNTSTMLTLMSVDQSQSAPLYISTVRKILRDMAATSQTGQFDYRLFKALLKGAKFSKMQRAPLEQRLEVLESFLDLENTTGQVSFPQGSITIVDLSCPFVDASTACILFDICLSIYLAGPESGKIIAVDEAHKYMTDTPPSKALTESLLSVIRQQRHFGVRVLLSTQEPTISPRLLDLCSATIIHRFSSPEWFDVLRRHVSASTLESGNTLELFEEIMQLDVGEAIVFAPSSTVSELLQCDRKGKKKVAVWERMGSKCIKIKVRKRLTWDGGRSVVCL